MLVQVGVLVVNLCAVHTILDFDKGPQRPIRFWPPSSVFLHREPGQEKPTRVDY